MNKFDYNDILITPAVTSYIPSRREVNPLNENGYLPLITAPMDTVVNNRNYFRFLENKIHVSLPRNTGIKSFSPLVFESMSLDEFMSRFIYVEKETHIDSIRNVLIDIANGHQDRLIEAIKSARKIYGSNLIIMVGNIANPETFKLLAEAGANSVRIGIGNGGGCLTTENSGVGYPMGSLIEECYQIKQTFNLKTQIISDGGIKSYSDIIKALALGADYVMIGSLFNKALESCGETKLFNRIKINPAGKFAQWALKRGFRITKRFRGMSTKEVQKSWGVQKLKTSEGVVRVRDVEYTLSQWTENFEDYLRSAMSYTNCKTLNEFRGKVNYSLITPEAYKRFNK